MEIARDHKSTLVGRRTARTVGNPNFLYFPTGPNLSANFSFKFLFWVECAMRKMWPNDLPNEVESIELNLSASSRRP
jgi:hypothetical protein